MWFRWYCYKCTLQRSSIPVFIVLKRVGVLSHFSLMITCCSNFSFFASSFFFRFPQEFRKKLVTKNSKISPLTSPIGETSIAFPDLFPFIFSRFSSEAFEKNKRNSEQAAAIVALHCLGIKKLNSELLWSVPSSLPRSRLDRPESQFPWTSISYIYMYVHISVIPDQIHVIAYLLVRIGKKNKWCLLDLCTHYSTVCAHLFLDFTDTVHHMNYRLVVIELRTECTAQ